MILECPECRTRYLVPDSAIGAEGRTVRCASCRHSWFQDPPVLDLARTPPPAEIAAAAPPPPTPPPSAVVTPEPVRPGYADAPLGEEPLAAPMPAPVRARRNPARRWTALAVAAGLLMLIGAGAILWSGAPGLSRSLGLSIGPAESPLRLRDNPIERRELENGSELFAVSGQVINPSSERQRVPDILVELKDAAGERGRTVYSWKITPERRSLPPGGTVDFNSAKLDVPANSKQLELSFVGDGA